MVLIPTGMRYTATATGSTIKQVTCEHCNVEYVYLMERQATGQGSSPLFLDNNGASYRAQDAARKNLQKALDKQTDLAPCPACGWLQKNMVRQVKRRRILVAVLMWFIASLFMGIIGGASSRNGPPTWLPYTALGVFALSAAFIVFTIVQNFNRNPRPQPQKKIMLRSDFEAAITAANNEKESQQAAQTQSFDQEIDQQLANDPASLDFDKNPQ